METLRKNQKEMLQIKDTATKMKNALVGLIRRLSTTEKRKDSLSLKIPKKKPPKQKSKEKKD